MVDFMKARSLKNILIRPQEVANIKRTFIDHKRKGYKPLTGHRLDQVITRLLFISENGRVKFNRRQEGGFIKNDCLVKGHRGLNYTIISGQVPTKGFLVPS